MVLYLCAENADITEDLSWPTHRTDRIRDRYAEIQHWIVGAAAWKQLREAERNYSHEAKTTSGEHRSPRPHERSGHWHHYWTGPLAGPRKLILRWVFPTFVGRQDSEDN